MTTTLLEIKPKCKLWLTGETRQSIFGDGKWRLLKAIDQTGSLKAATELLNISYRKAWGDLKKAQTLLGADLIEKHRGGKQGGTTCLTPLGKQWLNAYTAFRNDIDTAVDTAYEKHIKELNTN